jgi:hypothetical protein
MLNIQCDDQTIHTSYGQGKSISVANHTNNIGFSSCRKFSFPINKKYQLIYERDKNKKAAKHFCLTAFLVWLRGQDSNL